MQPTAKNFLFSVFFIISVFFLVNYVTETYTSSKNDTELVTTNLNQGSNLFIEDEIEPFCNGMMYENYINLKNVCLSILIILGFIFAFIMKKSLSQDQINILNHKGTEPAFSGDLLYNKEKGTYLCVGCDNVLFSSKKSLISALEKSSSFL